MARKVKESAEPVVTGLRIQRKEGKIFSHIRQAWREETPEERVRQEYVCILVNEYGYQLAQLAEEVEATGAGSGAARADLLIWRTPQAKADGLKSFIVVECKSDNVTIDANTYWQGANYAQYEQALFFVTHNNRETKYWKVDHARRMPNFDEIENIPHAEASQKDIDALLAKLKVFKEDEFADLLHQCHNIIRNREMKDPIAAFDEIAKILFVKVNYERKLRAGRARKNLFTAEYLDEQKQVYPNPLKGLFAQTKEDYKLDQIFDDRDEINLDFNTVRAIVKLLERYNLSDTSEDIKGIAFERFLGKTFRGEIGQFFTPRPIVEFMIRMIEPQETDVICDPASGSGGFLIRFFEIVRQQILADVDQQYQAATATIKRKRISESKKAELLRAKYDELQASIKSDKKNSRLWLLANRRIYGTDANERMARTSKMNMIMHGDGHGGVHHHNGFINVNGIFEERFNVVLTNPPFGSKVEKGKSKKDGTESIGHVIQAAEVEVSSEVYDRYLADYGKAYAEAQARVSAAIGKPITTLFELPKAGQTQIKTEILFIERCLALLQPGGRLGIVLPEGIFNNPSLAYVREFCEDRAYIRAVVSLPQETFYSSGATVKASLLFMQKFTAAEQIEYNTQQEQARLEVDTKYGPAIEAETQRLHALMDEAKKVKDTAKRQAAQKELREYLKRIDDLKKAEARALLKERWDYAIFMYEAEHVGITATGEADTNELYPNDNVPPGLEKTCLDLYREFRLNPQAFMLDEVVA